MQEAGATVKVPDNSPKRQHTTDFSIPKVSEVPRDNLTVAGTSSPSKKGHVQAISTDLRLETESSGLREEIRELRARIELDAKKMHFLSHYATRVKLDLDRVEGSKRRRSGELSGIEKQLFDMVSKEAAAAAEASREAEAKAKEDRDRFESVIRQLESSRSDLIERFTKEMQELKTSLHNRP